MKFIKCRKKKTKEDEKSLKREKNFLKKHSGVEMTEKILFFILDLPFTSSHKKKQIMYKKKKFETQKIKRIFKRSIAL